MSSQRADAAIGAGNTGSTNAEPTNAELHATDAGDVPNGLFQVHVQINPISPSGPSFIVATGRNNLVGTGTAATNFAIAEHPAFEWVHASSNLTCTVSLLGASGSGASSAIGFRGSGGLNFLHLMSVTDVGRA
jgi:hypothetical protein